MARTRRVKSENDAFYHVMSRIAGKRFLLKDPRIKRIMVDSLRISAEFSGVKIGSYVIMDDHFHLTVEVPTIETALVEIAKNLGTVPEKFEWKIPEEYPWSSAGGAARGEAFAVKCRNYTSSLIIGSADGNGDSPRKQGEESGVDVTKRVPQVGLGKILGGKEFVKASALEFSAALYGRRCRPKQVGGWAFSSHGHAEVAA